MTKRFRLSLRMGLVGCERHETVDIEVPDDASPEEIEEEVREYAEDWMWNRIELDWKEAGDTNG